MCRDERDPADKTRSQSDAPILVFDLLLPLPSLALGRRHDQSSKAVGVCEDEPETMIHASVCIDLVRNAGLNASYHFCTMMSFDRSITYANQYGLVDGDRSLFAFNDVVVPRLRDEWYVIAR